MRARCHALLVGVVFVSLAVESGFSQTASSSALIKRPIYDSPSIWELNSSVTNQYWNVYLFNFPKSGVYVFDLNTATNIPRSTLLGVVDPNWNRVVYSNMESFQAFGSFGTGTNQFKWPKSITAHAISDGTNSDGFYDVYIADTYNDRVCRLVYSPVSLTTGTIITGHGLNCPIDVAIDNGRTFRPNTDDKIWVLNSDNTLLNLTYNGSFVQSVALPAGCDASALVHSNWVPKLYVADTANDKAYKYSGYGGTYIKEYGAYSTTNSIVDIQVDPFGYLWALDKSSVFTKYDYNFTPLCQYYQPGQLGDCSGFSIALGVVGSPDMYVSEAWTPTSGMHHFVIGTDILNLQVTHDELNSQHKISYTAVDASVIDAAIYQYQDFGAKVKTLVNSQLMFAGQIMHVWNGTNDLGQQMPTGQYSYRVTSASAYVGVQSGQPVNRVEKTGSFYHVGPCPNPDATDPDQDRVCGADDNCFSVYNPTQEDSDGDGVGDACCCQGLTGNVDGDANNNVDISDLSVLIDYLYISFTHPQCMAEANCDGFPGGEIDISDLSALIDFLYVSFTPLSACVK